MLSGCHRFYPHSAPVDRYPPCLNLQYTLFSHALDVNDNASGQETSFSSMVSNRGTLLDTMASFSMLVTEDLNPYCRSSFSLFYPEEVLFKYVLGGG